MAKRVAIMGAGAVGSYLGAFLTREGHDVTLVDGWGEHVNMMKEGGLRVSGTQGEFTAGVNALHLGEIQSVREPFDVTWPPGIGHSGRVHGRGQRAAPG